MCFSAEASLVTGAALLGGGGFATVRAASTARAFVPLAVYPIAFGLQQIAEGALWIDLSSSPEKVSGLALAFLFFSHLFWPFWAPLSVYWLQRESRSAPLLLFLTALGATVGALLFIPLAWAGGVPVSVVDGHISYATAAVYDGSIAPNAVLLVYGLVVLVPFALANRRSVQAFGGLILLSMVVAYLFYAATYISVWCFFAAVISLYVIHLVVRRRSVAAA